MEGIAARCTVIEVATEALSGAGCGGIRTLKVRVRVVSRSSQRGGKSGGDGGGCARPIDGAGFRG